MKEISIIVPAYNSEKIIKKTIDSICDQENFDLSKLEIIIINDGSKDNTDKICLDLEKNNKLIKYIKISNIGPSGARNIGLKNATGKYIMFVDSDDICEKNLLSEVSELLKAEKTDLICFNYYELKNNKQIKTNQIIEKVYGNKENFEFIESMIRNKKFNPLWNKVYRSEIINKYNIKFDENIRMGEDFRFNLDYCERSEKIYTKNIYLYNYYINPEGLCSSYSFKDYHKKNENIEYYEKKLNENFQKNQIVADKYIDLIVNTSTEIIISKDKKKYSKIKKILEESRLLQVIQDTKKMSIERRFFIFLLKNKFIFLFGTYLKFRVLIKSLIK